MKVEGNIHLIGETETVGNNGFRKRQLVVKTNEQYAQTIGIDFVQDKTDLLNSYSIGQAVSVSVNIRGNEYNGKYYVNLQGWRIESVAAAPNTPSVPVDAFEPATDLNTEDHDDLPF